VPEAFTIGGVLVRTTAVGVLAGALLAVWLSGRLARLGGGDGARARGLAEGALWVGLLAARAAYVAANWPVFAEAPLSALALWRPGYDPISGAGLGAAWLLWRLGRDPAAERGARLRALAGAFAAGVALAGGVVLAVRFQPPPGVIAPGDPVADFRLIDLEGRPVRFSDLRGRPVVLNFWATWCGPCRREMPLLDALRREWAASGLEVVGVDVGEPTEQVRAFVAEVGVGYPIWVDGPAGAGYDRSTEVYRRTGSVGLPTTLFVDRDGVMVSKYLGELDRGLLESRVRQLVGRRGVESPPRGNDG